MKALILICVVVALQCFGDVAAKTFQSPGSRQLQPKVLKNSRQTTVEYCILNTKVQIRSFFGAKLTVMKVTDPKKTQISNLIDVYVNSNFIEKAPNNICSTTVATDQTLISKLISDIAPMLSGIATAYIDGFSLILKQYLAGEKMPDVNCLTDQADKDKLKQDIIAVFNSLSDKLKSILSTIINSFFTTKYSEVCPVTAETSFTIVFFMNEISEACANENMDSKQVEELMIKVKFYLLRSCVADKAAFEQKIKDMLPMLQIAPADETKIINILTKAVSSKLSQSGSQFCPISSDCLDESKSEIEQILRSYVIDSKVLNAFYMILYIEFGVKERPAVSRSSVDMSQMSTEMEIQLKMLELNEDEIGPAMDLFQEIFTKLQGSALAEFEFYFSYQKLSDYMLSVRCSSSQIAAWSEILVYYLVGGKSPKVCTTKSETEINQYFLGFLEQSEISEDTQKKIMDDPVKEFVEKLKDAGWCFDFMVLEIENMMSKIMVIIVQDKQDIPNTIQTFKLIFSRYFGLVAGVSATKIDPNIKDSLKSWFKNVPLDAQDKVSLYFLYLLEKAKQNNYMLADYDIHIEIGKILTRRVFLINNLDTEYLSVIDTMFDSCFGGEPPTVFKTTAAKIDEIKVNLKTMLVDNIKTTESVATAVIAEVRAFTDTLTVLPDGSIIGTNLLLRIQPTIKKVVEICSSAKLDEGDTTLVRKFIEAHCTISTTSSTEKYCIDVDAIKLKIIEILKNILSDDEIAAVTEIIDKYAEKIFTEQGPNGLRCANVDISVHIEEMSNKIEEKMSKMTTENKIEMIKILISVFIGGEAGRAPVCFPGTFEKVEAHYKEVLIALTDKEFAERIWPGFLGFLKANFDRYNKGKTCSDSAAYVYPMFAENITQACRWENTKKICAQIENIIVYEISTGDTERKTCADIAIQTKQALVDSIAEAVTPQLSSKEGPKQCKEMINEVIEKSFFEEKGRVCTTLGKVPAITISIKIEEKSVEWGCDLSAISTIQEIVSQEAGVVKPKEVEFIGTVKDMAKSFMKMAEAMPEVSQGILQEFERSCITTITKHSKVVGNKVIYKKSSKFMEEIKKTAIEPFCVSMGITVSAAKLEEITSKCLSSETSAQSESVMTRTPAELITIFGKLEGVVVNANSELTENIKSIIDAVMQKFTPNNGKYSAKSVDFLVEKLYVDVDLECQQHDVDSNIYLKVLKKSCGDKSESVEKASLKTNNFSEVLSAFKIGCESTDLKPKEKEIALSVVGNALTILSTGNCDDILKDVMKTCSGKISTVLESVEADGKSIEDVLKISELLVNTEETAVNTEMTFEKSTEEGISVIRKVIQEYSSLAQSEVDQIAQEIVLKSKEIQIPEAFYGLKMKAFSLKVQEVLDRRGLDPEIGKMCESKVNIKIGIEQEQVTSVGESEEDVLKLFESSFEDAELDEAEKNTCLQLSKTFVNERCAKQGNKFACFDIKSNMPALMMKIKKSTKIKGERLSLMIKSVETEVADIDTEEVELESSYVQISASMKTNLKAIVKTERAEELFNIFDKHSRSRCKTKKGKLVYRHNKHSKKSMLGKIKRKCKRQYGMKESEINFVTGCISKSLAKETQESKSVILTETTESMTKKIVDIIETADSLDTKEIDTLRSEITEFLDKTTEIVYNKKCFTAAIETAEIIVSKVKERFDKFEVLDETIRSDCFATIRQVVAKVATKPITKAGSVETLVVSHQENLRKCGVPEATVIDLKPSITEAVSNLCEMKNNMCVIPSESRIPVFKRKFEKILKNRNIAEETVTVATRCAANSFRKRGKRGKITKAFAEKKRARCRATFKVNGLSDSDVNEIDEEHTKIVNEIETSKDADEDELVIERGIARIEKKLKGKKVKKSKVQRCCNSIRSAFKLTSVKTVTITNLDEKITICKKAIESIQVNVDVKLELINIIDIIKSAFDTQSSGASVCDKDLIDDTIEKVKEKLSISCTEVEISVFVKVLKFAIAGEEVKQTCYKSLEEEVHKPIDTLVDDLEIVENARKDIKKLCRTWSSKLFKMFAGSSVFSDSAEQSIDKLTMLVELKVTCETYQIDLAKSNKIKNLFCTIFGGVDAPTTEATSQTEIIESFKQTSEVLKVQVNGLEKIKSFCEKNIKLDDNGILVIKDLDTVIEPLLKEIRDLNINLEKPKLDACIELVRKSCASSSQTLTKTEGSNVRPEDISDSFLKELKVVEDSLDIDLIIKNMIDDNFKTVNGITVSATISVTWKMYAKQVEEKCIKMGISAVKTKTLMEMFRRRFSVESETTKVIEKDKTKEEILIGIKDGCRNDYKLTEETINKLHVEVELIVKNGYTQQGNKCSSKFASLLFESKKEKLVKILTEAGCTSTKSSCILSDMSIQLGIKEVKQSVVSGSSEKFAENFAVSCDGLTVSENAKKKMKNKIKEIIDSIAQSKDGELVCSMHPKIVQKMCDEVEVILKEDNCPESHKNSILTGIVRLTEKEVLSFEFRLEGEKTASNILEAIKSTATILGVSPDTCTKALAPLKEVLDKAKVNEGGVLVVSEITVKAKIKEFIKKLEDEGVSKDVASKCGSSVESKYLPEPKTGSESTVTSTQTCVKSTADSKNKFIEAMKGVKIDDTKKGKCSEKMDQCFKLFKEYKENGDICSEDNEIITKCLEEIPKYLSAVGVTTEIVETISKIANVAGGTQKTETVSQEKSTQSIIDTCKTITKEAKNADTSNAVASLVKEFFDTNFKVESGKNVAIGNIEGNLEVLKGKITTTCAEKNEDEMLSELVNVQLSVDCGVLEEITVSLEKSIEEYVIEFEAYFSFGAFEQSTVDSFKIHCETFMKEVFETRKTSVDFRRKCRKLELNLKKVCVRDGLGFDVIDILYEIIRNFFAKDITIDFKVDDSSAVTFKSLMEYSGLSASLVSSEHKRYGQLIERFKKCRSMKLAKKLTELQQFGFARRCRMENVDIEIVTTLKLCIERGIGIGSIDTEDEDSLPDKPDKLSEDVSTECKLLIPEDEKTVSPLFKTCFGFFNGQTTSRYGRIFKKLLRLVIGKKCAEKNISVKRIENIMKYAETVASKNQVKTCLKVSKEETKTQINDLLPDFELPSGIISFLKRESDSSLENYDANGCGIALKEKCSFLTERADKSLTDAGFTEKDSMELSEALKVCLGAKDGTKVFLEDSFEKLIEETIKSISVFITNPTDLADCKANIKADINDIFIKIDGKVCVQSIELSRRRLKIRIRRRLVALSKKHVKLTVTVIDKFCEYFIDYLTSGKTVAVKFNALEKIEVVKKNIEVILVMCRFTAVEIKSIFVELEEVFLLFKDGDSSECAHLVIDQVLVKLMEIIKKSKFYRAEFEKIAVMIKISLGLEKVDADQKKCVDLASAKSSYKVSVSGLKVSAADLNALQGNCDTFFDTIYNIVENGKHCCLFADTMTTIFKAQLDVTLTELKVDAASKESVAIAVDSITASDTSKQGSNVIKGSSTEITARIMAIIKARLTDIDINFFVVIQMIIETEIKIHITSEMTLSASVAIVMTKISTRIRSECEKYKVSEVRFEGIMEAVQTECGVKKKEEVKVGNSLAEITSKCEKDLNIKDLQLEARAAILVEFQSFFDTNCEVRNGEIFIVGKVEIKFARERIFRICSKFKVKTSITSIIIKIFLTAAGEHSDEDEVELPDSPKEMLGECESILSITAPGPVVKEILSITETAINQRCNKNGPRTSCGSSTIIIEVITDQITDTCKRNGLSQNMIIKILAIITRTFRKDTKDVVTCLKAKKVQDLYGPYDKLIRSMPMPKEIMKKVLARYSAFTTKEFKSNNNRMCCRNLKYKFSAVREFLIGFLEKSKMSKEIITDCNESIDKIIDGAPYKETCLSTAYNSVDEVADDIDVELTSSGLDKAASTAITKEVKNCKKEFKTNSKKRMCVQDFATTKYKLYGKILTICKKYKVQMFKSTAILSMLRYRLSGSGKSKEICVRADKADIKVRCERVLKCASVKASTISVVMKETDKVIASPHLLEKDDMKCGKNMQLSFDSFRFSLESILRAGKVAMSKDVIDGLMSAIGTKGSTATVCAGAKNTEEVLKIMENYLPNLESIIRMDIRAEAKKCLNLIFVVSSDGFCASEGTYTIKICISRIERILRRYKKSSTVINNCVNAVKVATGLIIPPNSDTKQAQVIKIIIEKITIKLKKITVTQEFTNEMMIIVEGMLKKGLTVNSAGTVVKNSCQPLLKSNEKRILEVCQKFKFGARIHSYIMAIFSITFGGGVTKTLTFNLVLFERICRRVLEDLRSNRIENYMKVIKEHVAEYSVNSGKYVVISEANANVYLLLNKIEAICEGEDKVVCETFVAHLKIAIGGAGKKLYCAGIDQITQNLIKKIMANQVPEPQLSNCKNTLNILMHRYFVKRKNQYCMMSHYVGVFVVGLKQCLKEKTEPEIIDTIEDSCTCKAKALPTAEDDDDNTVDLIIGDIEEADQSHEVKKVPGKKSAGKAAPEKSAPGKAPPKKPTPGKTAPSQKDHVKTAPGKTAPSQKDHVKTAPGKTNPPKAPSKTVKTPADNSPKVNQKPKSSPAKPRTVAQVVKNVIQKIKEKFSSQADPVASATDDENTSTIENSAPNPLTPENSQSALKSSSNNSFNPITGTFKVTERRHRGL